MQKSMKTGEATARLEPQIGAGKKIPCIIDKACVLKTFFNYSATTCCLVEPIIQAAMSGGKVEPEKMAELMRVAYVNAAKHGNKLVYRCGGGVPTGMGNWFGTGTGKFDPEVVFNSAKNHERDQFATIVKKFEDKDRFGNDEIYPSDDMSIILLFEAEEQQTIDTIIKDCAQEIPNFATYFEVYVNDN
jgi:hypothetical protein